MMNLILRTLLAILACVGLVQTISWIAVRRTAKQVPVARVFPVGGEGRDTGKQMAAMYACLQWEANPSGQGFVLYDAGLDEQGVRDCETLAAGAGISFVRKGQLESYLERVVKSARF